MTFTSYVVLRYVALFISFGCSLVMLSSLVAKQNSLISIRETSLFSQSLALVLTSASG